MSYAQVQPYNTAQAITTSDTVCYDGGTFAKGTKNKIADAILVGDAGIVIAAMEDNTTFRLTATAGMIIPIRTIRINSTTTTATNMYALYTV